MTEWPSHIGLYEGYLEIKISLCMSWRLFVWVEVYLHSLWTSTLHEGGWSASLHGHIPGWWAPRTHEWETMWNPEPVWMLWRREKFLALAENWTAIPRTTSHYLVTILNELPRVPLSAKGLMKASRMRRIQPVVALRTGEMTREDGTDTLSRNVGKQLPHDAA
jgi:hypothetical protein